MLYFAVVFVLALLGSYALYEWCLGRRPSKKELESLHQEIRQLIALEDWEAAAKKLQPCLKRSAGEPTNTLLRCQILRGRRQLDQALDLVQQALAKDPNSLLLLQERGRTWLELGHAEEALTDLRRSEVVLHSEEGMLDLATALYQTGRINEAWHYLKDHVLESCNGRLLALAGDCQFHWNNHALAIRFYQQAQHFGWFNHRTLSRTGHSLRCTGNFQEAERYFRAILAQDSSDITATLGLGTCLEAKGLHQRALLVYQSGQAWDLGHPILLRQAGICAVHTEQYAHAEMYLREAIAGGASTPQALANLAYALEQQKRWSEAEEVYLELTEEFQEHPAGYRGLAWLFGVGKSQNLSSEAGLWAARQALKLLPEASSWELLSACEARAGNFTRAHDIHEQLSSQPCDKLTQQRRRRAMRSLRKRIPLDEEQVCRTLVA